MKVNTNKNIEQILKEFEKKSQIAKLIMQIIPKNIQVQTTAGD